YANKYVGGGANTASFGRNLMGYTATLGNGVSWTVSAEDTTSRRGALWDAGTNSMSIGSFPGPNTWNGTGYPTCGFGAVTSDNNIGNTAAPLSVSGACATGDYAAQSIPDIVSSLRVDQAWGSAQISGALHQVRGNFYGNDVQSTITTGPTAFTGTRPDDVWGWAVAGGIVLNLPWNAGDKFWVEGAVGEGTPCYVGFCQDGVNGTFTRFDGHNVMNGWALDGVFANAVGNNTISPAGSAAGCPAGATCGTNFTGIQLPTVWDIAAAVEHYWTPALRTSLFGSVTSWDPGSSGNAIMCNSPNAPTRGIAGQTGAPGVPTPANYGTNPISGGAIAGCNYAFELFAVGTRTVWNPVKNLDIGVEVMWSQIHQNMDPSKIALNFGGGGNRAAGFYSPSDENVVSGMFRVQRNFWP
ncbi:MAG: porin, partial [Bradyrhizobiaceae bacterium]|nr:porin [Bradyrhizobiaceae bacterium]